MHWLIDGMNLIGSRPDGWWRDRPDAQRRLVGELGRLVESDGGSEVTVTVVFDGRAPGGDPVDPAGVEVVYAPGAPDAADDVIAEMAAATGERSGTVVVTSDAGLAGRVRASGLGVVGVRAFRDILGAST
ncbi:MAG: NYN domain-containing protein [Acidimicrobiales bacterium]